MTVDEIDDAVASAQRWLDSGCSEDAAQYIDRFAKALLALRPPHAARLDRDAIALRRAVANFMGKPVDMPWSITFDDTLLTVHFSAGEAVAP